MKRVRFSIFLVISIILASLWSCAITGWNENFLEFIETGMSPVYLASSSWRGVNTTENIDVRSGDTVTVLVKLNNPKGFDLVYTLSVDSRLVDGTPVAPTGTTGAENKITTVSFEFIPTEAAEHGDIVFTLGVTCPTINRTFDPVVVKVHCESPPDPVVLLVAGEDSNQRACFAFTLPESEKNADIKTVRIRFTSAPGTTLTHQLSVTTTGSELTTVPMYLESFHNSLPLLPNYRFFFTDDITPNNPNEFTVWLIDESGKVSTPKVATVIGTECTLSYDLNYGSGTAPEAQTGYFKSMTTVSNNTITRVGYTFTGWNTVVDGTGDFYLSGANFVFPPTHTILYAQWNIIPIEVSTKAELIDALVNPQAHIILTTTIDLTGVVWDPINFSGTFDGGGNTITGLTVTDKANAGMFSVVGSGGVVKNLHLAGASLEGTSKERKGAIAVENNGLIYRCSSSGVVKGSGFIGGLVGTNLGIVRECWSNAKVTATGTSSGGLVGINGQGAQGTETGLIENCYARGAVNVNHGGGLVGSNNSLGTVRNSYAAGFVTPTGTSPDVQALIGSNDVPVVSCYFDESKCSASSDNGSPKTSAQMKDSGTFINWNFTDPDPIWGIDPDINDGYPHLLNVKPIIIEITQASMSATDFTALINSNLSGNYKLTKTLTLDGSFTPINEFFGTFDGGGFAIEGLKVIDASPGGLFKRIAEGATVRNLHLTDVIINCSGYSNVGGLVGINNGNISRCSVSGTIRGYTSVGGLAAYNSGTISECWSTATVSGDSYVGGLVAENIYIDMRKPAIIENCYYAQGTVTAISGGGLVGKNDTDASVRKCYATGTVSLKGGSPGANSYIQGLVGNNVNTTSIIENSFFDSSTIGTSYANGSPTTTYNGTPKAIIDMKTMITFTTDPADWNIADGLNSATIWGIGSNYNNGYPYLQWAGATNQP